MCAGVQHDALGYCAICAGRLDSSRTARYVPRGCCGRARAGGGCARGCLVHHPLMADGRRRRQRRQRRCARARPRGRFGGAESERPRTSRRRRAGAVPRIPRRASPPEAAGGRPQHAATGSARGPVWCPMRGLGPDPPRGPESPGQAVGTE